MITDEKTIIIQCNCKVPGAKKLEPDEIPDELLVSAMLERAEGQKKPIYFYEVL